MFSMNIAYSLAAAALGFASAKLAAQEPVEGVPVKTTLGLYRLTQANLQGPSDQKKVSVHFQKAHVREVLDWLQKSGLDFVVADSEMKDRTVTMSITNQPVGDVLKALGTALDGHWVSEGNIRVFKNGSASPFGGVADTGTDFQFPKGPYFRSPDSKFNELPNKKDFEIGPESKFKSDSPRYQWPATPKLDFGNGLLFKDGDRVQVKGFHSLIQILTGRQRQLEKSQGFLYFDDLTPEQKAMVGVHGSPSHEDISYSGKDNSESLILKSKPSEEVPTAPVGKG